MHLSVDQFASLLWFTLISSLVYQFIVFIIIIFAIHQSFTLLLIVLVKLFTLQAVFDLVNKHLQ